MKMFGCETDYLLSGLLGATTYNSSLAPGKPKQLVTNAFILRSISMKYLETNHFCLLKGHLSKL